MFHIHGSHLRKSIIPTALKSNTKWQKNSQKLELDLLEWKFKYTLSASLGLLLEKDYQLLKILSNSWFPCLASFDGSSWTGWWLNQNLISIGLWQICHWSLKNISSVLKSISSVLIFHRRCNREESPEESCNGRGGTSFLWISFSQQQSHLDARRPRSLRSLRKGT